MNNNKIIIDALTSFYGFTIKEAKSYLKDMTEKRKQLIIENYKQQNKKAFYND